MMELKAGYKQTEVGIIPEDWKVKTLESFVTIKSGESPSKYKLLDNGIPYYKVEQLNNSSKYQQETPYYIESCNVVPKGSLIFPKRGASILLNKIRILSDDSFMDTNLMTLTISEEISNEYLYYRLLKTELWRIADTTSIPQINNKHINPLKIPIPPTKTEQTAIATALSDADALINSLDKLITKKRLIKQGAMQELLSGKKRLAGFSGEWEVKKLGDIAVVATGNTPPTNDKSNYGDEYFFVSPADLGKGKYIINTEKKLSKKGFDISRKFPKDSVLFTCIGSTIGKSGIAPFELTSNQQINAVFPNEKLSSDFLFYALNQLSLKIKSLASEQAVPLINKTDFEENIIPLPPTKEEQTAIAQILSDMDTDILALETERNKTLAIKQGMMQELLTGKTRLI